MKKNDIIEWLDKAEAQSSISFVDLPEEFYSEIDQEFAKVLGTKYESNLMIKLPKREIEFFEWLKKEDREVWDDIWFDESGDDFLYYVNIGFLQFLVSENYTGFPICGLATCDNFYFVPDHLVGLEAKTLVEASKTKYFEKGKLSPNQLLAVEISFQPIDVWHFAYKYKLSIENAKNAVTELVNDDALVHLKECEHISEFVKF